MKILDNFELFLFDLDGVVYIDEKPTRGAVKAINTTRTHNKKVLFITNNPARSKNEYSEKLRNLGINAKKYPFDVVSANSQMLLENGHC